MNKNEKLYAFLESSTINPAGLSMMGYYSYVEISKDGLIKRKLWGKDNLNQLPGKHGVRGKFSADQNYLIIHLYSRMMNGKENLNCYVFQTVH